MFSPVFSELSRESEISQAENGFWDVLIVGGGISGAACARDAQLRGLRTLLVEADDFASGTSSGSSKLLHGGVRYLQNLEFKLVYTAIQERERLQKLYAPFVRKIDFVFPTYKGTYPSRLALHMGLSLYDSFTYFKERHRSLRRKKTLERFPLLDPQGLTGAMVYADSFAEDYRLVIELIKSAVQEGAVCLSRCPATYFEKTDTGFKVGLRDRMTERDYKVSARSVINCSGPFSDQVRALLQIPPSLHLTQGVHFIVKRERLPIDEAYVLSDPEKNRILFAIPWNSVSYLGTTDTSISHPSEARATHEDLRYVLRIASKYFGSRIQESDVIQSWAAVRPLIRPGKDADNSKISREHQIEENPKGFFHLLGGKLTSHREMAEEIVDSLCKGKRPCLTQVRPLQGRAWTKPEEGLTHLEAHYGHAADDVRQIDEERKLERQKISSEHPQLVSEVLYGAHHEMLMSPIDYLRRRSSLYYENPQIELAEAVGEILRKELNWSPSRFDVEMKKTLQNYEWDTQGFHA